MCRLCGQYNGSFRNNTQRGAYGETEWYSKERKGGVCI